MPSVGLSAPVEQSAKLIARLPAWRRDPDGRLRDHRRRWYRRTGAGAHRRAPSGASEHRRRRAEHVELLVATDQEYGWVTRIRSGLVQLPSAMAFGAAGRPELTRAAWNGAGQELAAVGINVDFAPDADVIGPPGNFVIGSRSYGADPDLVGPQVAAAVSGLQSGGVAAAIKHFPGHGNTTVNSHDALPVLTQSRDAASSRPTCCHFRPASTPGRGSSCPGTWTCRQSTRAYRRASRARCSSIYCASELGFTGVVVTDALNMEPGEAVAPGRGGGPGRARGQRPVADAAGSGGPRSRDCSTRSAPVACPASAWSRRSPGARAEVQARRRSPARRSSTVDSPAHREAAPPSRRPSVTVLRGPCSGPLVTGPVRVTTSGGRGQQGSG